jgi:hypothetical protein
LHCIRNFIALPDNKTKYISEEEFQFNGFMKIIGFLIPSVFKKTINAIFN